jgi:hypothetical protein
VIWIAQRQKSTALSLIKAEIITALKEARSVVWLKKLTKDLKKRDNVNPFISMLYYDNKSIVDLSYDTKHY